MTKELSKESDGVPEDLDDLDSIHYLEFEGEKQKTYEALMKLRAEILAQTEFLSDEALHSQKDSGGDLSSMSTHMADSGSDYSMKSMELGMLTDETELLERIEEAVQRLANDEYGQCLDCDAMISKGRLDALPYARFCIKCQSIREKNGGFRPDLAD